jgi:hypothetical protein
MKTTGRILLNAMKTPDGTILVSRYGHDYKGYTDKNGKYYMIDGGIEFYTRRSINGDEVMITITDSDPFEDVRIAFAWGTRGKDMTGSIRFVPLCDMTDEHLDAVIQYCYQFNRKKYVDIFEEEVKYRKENGISVREKKQIKK